MHTAHSEDKSHGATCILPMLRPMQSTKYTFMPNKANHLRSTLSNEIKNKKKTNRNLRSQIEILTTLELLKQQT